MIAHPNPPEYKHVKVQLATSAHNADADAAVKVKRFVNAKC